MFKGCRNQTTLVLVVGDLLSKYSYIKNCLTIYVYDLLHDILRLSYISPGIYYRVNFDEAGD